VAVADSLDDLASAVPSRPAGDLDDAQMLAKAPDGARWDFTVASVDRIAQDMLRVTMSAPGIETLKWVPAQDFTLLVTRSAGRDIRRRYTIAGQHGGTVWFDVYLHGQGVGTSWAMALRTGDTVSGIGPRGKFLLERDAEWILLLGDETSLPGILAMLAASDRPARVVVEVDNADAWSHVGAGQRADTEWTWLSRTPSRGDHGPTLPASGGGHAYVSGQAERVRYWRTHLESLGLDPSAITHKAYWGAGRANATHGEPLE
jgi:NADPH-dependent ferric siderophore reductase